MPILLFRPEGPSAQNAPYCPCRTMPRGRAPHNPSHAVPDHVVMARAMGRTMLVLLAWCPRGRGRVAPGGDAATRDGARCGGPHYAGSGADAAATNAPGDLAC